MQIIISGFVILQKTQPRAFRGFVAELPLERRFGPRKGFAPMVALCRGERPISNRSCIFN